MNEACVCAALFCPAGVRAEQDSFFLFFLACGIQYPFWSLEPELELELGLELGLELELGLRIVCRKGREFSRLFL